MSKKRKSKKTGEALAKEARDEIADRIATLEDGDGVDAPAADEPATEPVKPRRKPKATPKPKAPPKGKPKAEKAPRPLSLVRAAIQVLEEDRQKEGMNTSELVKAVADRGLWESPAGKTPDRTLYAAFLAELKKDEPRIVKVGPGRFKAS